MGLNELNRYWSEHCHHACPDYFGEFGEGWNLLFVFWNFKTYPMPLSFHGFAPAAILIMILCLVTRQVYDYWKQHHTKS